ncbi:hypothetical protein [Siphonobacter sp. BAB-5385]|uniref:hypothetical protein n=1 Tax=Siphonobacter sp. BAB-5385 TaxID=1864822 RepID=UPI0026A3591A
MASAQVRLPKFISDGMILQRDTPLKIWGWAKPGEKVTVRFKNKTYKATTPSDGKWQVTLPALPAGGPFQMEIAGSNRISIQDILLGDVWFCSGQSNMVHQLNIHDVTYAEEIRTANYPQIRQFWVPTLSNLQSPQAELPQGQWKAAVGEDVRPFSAVAYFSQKRCINGIKSPSASSTPAWVAHPSKPG